MLVWVGGGVSSGLEVVLLVGFRVQKNENARVSSPLPISRVFHVWTELGWSCDVYIFCG